MRYLLAFCLISPAFSAEPIKLTPEVRAKLKLIAFDAAPLRRP